MCDSETSALDAPKGDISLVFCKACGFIRNQIYDSEKISFEAYDFSHDHSPLFRAYVQEICERLITKYNVKGKTVLDVGSGDGDFLMAICQKGENHGIGIDPGFDHSERRATFPGEVKFIRDYYSEKYTDLKPDLVVCRHVIHQLVDQQAFLRTLRGNLDHSPDTIVYIEVPNVLYTYEEKVIWNVAYEHSVSFTVDSLSYMMESCGFEVIQAGTYWNNEFIGIEARPKALRHASPDLPSPQRMKKLSETIKSFSEAFEDMIEQNKIKITRFKENNLKTIAWGAGARAVTFFNLFDLQKEVPFIVDINTYRHGKFLPGSAQEIVPPDFVTKYDPDLVIITNPTYAKEIQDSIAAMDLSPEIWIL
jgi:2-polyprenyl-3-methyl-5-hydroxy-6-metoxy-1,4-benzoquinol methylase